MQFSEGSGHTRILRDSRTGEVTPAPYCQWHLHPGQTESAPASTPVGRTVTGYVGGSRRMVADYLTRKGQTGECATCGSRWQLEAVRPSHGRGAATVWWKRIA